MNTLLLIAHGSRKPGANEAIMDLANQVQTLAGQPARCAFLQFGQPELPAALAELVAAGCESVTIVPLVFTAGKHLEEDIEAVAATLRRTYPRLEVVVSPHLGAWNGLPRAILDLAAQTGSRPPQ